MQTAGQIKYIIMDINGNTWGYTAGATTDPNAALATIQTKVANHKNTGIAADKNTFTEYDRAAMQYTNNNLIDETVEIPLDKIAGQTVALNNLKRKITDPTQLANINRQINDNNAKIAKLEAAMAGGRRRRHGRSKRRMLKKARRHAKTRRSRR